MGELAHVLLLVLLFCCHCRALSSQVAAIIICSILASVVVGCTSSARVRDEGGVSWPAHPPAHPPTSPRHNVRCILYLYITIMQGCSLPSLEQTVQAAVCQC